MTDEMVHLEVADEVATITLDSPRNRNALSAQLRRELSGHLDVAIADRSVRVIVLSHTGPVFCAGMDLKESRGAGADEQGVREFPAILEQILHSRTPVITRLAGPARAGGIGMVAAADLAVAAEDVTFAFSEVRIGLVPAVISAAVLPRVSPRAAAELLLTGESFDGGRAATIGLINRAVPAGELDAEVARYVELLRLGAPGALAATKEMLRRERPAAPGADLDSMIELSARYFASAEAQEGM